MLSIIGLILIILPFLSLFYVKRNIKNLSIVTFIWFCSHISIGFILLILGHFNVFFATTLHLSIYFSIFVYLKKKGNLIFNPICEVNTPAIISCVIIVLSLASVHLNYTGYTINANGDFVYVENEQILYPTYSDEWVGIAYIRESLLYNKIPLHNPFSEDEPFISFAFLYYIFLAELVLLLGISPIIFYVIGKVVLSTSILFSIYYLLKKLGISVASSCITILLILFITNSVLVPGLWYMIPFSFSVLLFFLSLNNFISSNIREFLLLSFISFVLYPPSFVLFFIVSICGYIFDVKKVLNYKTILYFLIFIFLLSLSMFLSIISFSESSFADVVDRAFGFIVRTNLLAEGWLYNIELFNIIPFRLFCFCVPALVLLWFRKKYFLASTVTVFLIIYFIYKNIQDYSFVIDFVRFVYITAIISIIPLAFMFDYIKVYFYRLNIKPQYYYVLMFSIFIILSFNYTKINGWESVGMKNGNKFYIERAQSDPPIQSRYSSEEFEIFKTLGKSRVLAPSWKGLIYGAVSDVHFLDIKPSVTGHREALLSDFMILDCDRKIEFSRKYNIDYVYSRVFFCPNFVENIKISNTYMLYKFIGNK